MKLALYALFFCALSAGQAIAQKPVYRCEQGGKIAYSDEPCVGAKRVDVTPTRGMDRMTGERRKGADVRREETLESMAEVMKPVLGETPEQYKTRHRRSKHTEADRKECYKLDASLAALETRRAQDAETELYRARKRYFDLRC